MTWFPHHEATADWDHAYLILDIPPSLGGMVQNAPVPCAAAQNGSAGNGLSLPLDYPVWTSTCTQSWLYPQDGEDGLYICITT